MSNFSDYVENGILSRILKASAVALPVPSALYVALFTADPGEDATINNEAAYPGYARQDSDGGGATGSGWSTPAGGVSSNLNSIEFPANGSATPVTITHMAIIDSASGTGNLYFVAPLTASKTLQQNDKVVFDVGNIAVTVD